MVNEANVSALLQFTILGGGQAQWLTGFRSLPGPPLTEESNIRALLAHNVTVGLGIVEGWEARNTRFDAAWVCYPMPIALSDY